MLLEKFFLVPPVLRWNHIQNLLVCWQTHPTQAIVTDIFLPMTYSYCAFANAPFYQDMAI